MLSLSPPWRHLASGLVAQQAWVGIKNGKSLALVAAEFDVFVTDCNFVTADYPQSFGFSGRRVARGGVRFRHADLSVARR
jgi:hypothetical protein